MTDAKPVDAETRAALEWAINLAHSYADSALGFRELRKHGFALQALLDVKGGEPYAHRRSEDSEHHREIGSDSPRAQVAGAASTAPPDSAAKIAAELRSLHPSGYVYSTYRESPYEYNDKWVARMIDDCQRLAARVEALGLEPSEREAIEFCIDQAEQVGFKGGQPHWARMVRIARAALAPIAEKGTDT